MRPQPVKGKQIEQWTLPKWAVFKKYDDGTEFVQGVYYQKEPADQFAKMIRTDVVRVCANIVEVSVRQIIVDCAYYEVAE